MKILLRIYDYELPNIYCNPKKADGWARAPVNAGGDGERTFGRTVPDVRLPQPSHAPGRELKNRAPCVN